MSDLFDRLLEALNPLILPDWGALVLLIPVGLAALVILWLIFTVRKFATAGPTRRGKQRIQPRPPEGIHAPGPSFSPILGAIGVFLLLAGLVTGGALLIAGVAALVLSLLYWGREALADFDHVTHADRPVVANVHAGPPPGVHMPGPSFRPILVSLALGLLFAGLVFGGLVLAIGIVALVVTLLGWLRDARREYVHAVEADHTGHLRPLPTPGWPKGLLWVFTILVVVAVVLDVGVLRPGGGTAAGGPGASGEPGASGGPGGPSTPPPAGNGIALEAVAPQRFNTDALEAPADEPFEIRFNNTEANVLHDVAIQGPEGLAFNGEDITGPGEIVYQVPALTAGDYTFICTLHPQQMTGTLTVGG
jgi:hypothetical protein